MRRIFSRHNPRVVGAAALFCLLCAGAAACPMCKENLVPDPSGGTGPSSLARGFAYSIYLMMAVPYLLVASITWWVVRAYRRKPSAGVSE
jgi:hypothetical protein